ncbi:MAG: hypothetical protein L0Z50_09160 [Verrucomicrobiales bacterium]|nr:hypothetical protein [Verrucomicrobiales bacterium]
MIAAVDDGGQKSEAGHDVVKRIVPNSKGMTAAVTTEAHTWRWLARLAAFFIGQIHECVPMTISCFCIVATAPDINEPLQQLKKPFDQHGSDKARDEDRRSRY